MINWKEPKELKIYDKPLLCWTNNYKFITLKDGGDIKEHWKFLVEKYHILYWIYQDEIAPSIDSKES